MLSNPPEKRAIALTIKKYPYIIVKIKSAAGKNAALKNYYYVCK